MILALVAAAAVASPDPYQIFARARAYWDAQTYPRYVDYDTVVDVHDGHGERTERYASAYDSTDGTTWVDPVSDYELAHPATGRGVDLGFGIGGGGSGSGSGHKAAPDIDFIGVPLLAPNYSFTIGRFNASAPTLDDPTAIVQAVREQFHDPNPHPSAAPTNGLHEIGAVEAFNHEYRIDRGADDIINGISAYHLTLSPFRADGSYRLRDLWINKTTFATIRARTSLNFVDGPGTRISWTIDFADVSGARYIASEAAGAAYVYGGRKYDRVSVRFESIRAREAPLPYAPVRVSAFLILTEPRS
jgi:hypothetical protein